MEEFDPFGRTIPREPLPAAEPPAEAKPAKDDRVRKLTKQVAELQDEIRRRDAEAREIELASSLRFTPRIIEPTEHEVDSPGMPILHWSDWHCGEEVDRRETGGLNEFNRDIFHARVDSLVRNTIMLLRDYSGRRPVYPGVWVNLGGDMISGKIHEELRETNWGTVEEQAYDVGGALAGALTAMADEFGEVNVIGIVGNHGRNAIKPRSKTKVRENREWGIYKSLERQFESDKRFTFHIPDGPDFLFSIYGHRFFVTHGDTLGTKGGDGIIGSIGPIKRGHVKIRGAEVPVGRDFDWMMVGHFHSYQPPGVLFPVWVNGTLKGSDEFALTTLRAGYARPSQSFGIVAPKYGLVDVRPVYV